MARGARVYKQTPVKKATAKSKKKYTTQPVLRVVSSGSNQMFRPGMPNSHMRPRPRA